MIEALPVFLAMLTGPAVSVPALSVPHAVAAPAARTSEYAPLKSMVRIKPMFPPKEQYGGQQACVDIEFTVGTDGRPSDVQVWAHYPREAREFDAQAESALRGWRFTPRKVDGKAVATANVHQEFLFSIDSGRKTVLDTVTDTLGWLCEQPPLHGISIVASATRAAAAKTVAGGDENIWKVAQITPNLLPTRAPQGQVRLRFCVDAEGRAADTIVDRSSPPGVYDEAARAALVATDFSARKQGGTAVTSCGLNALVRFDGSDSGKVGTISDMTFNNITATSPVPKLVAQKPARISLHIPAGTPLPKVAKVEVRMCIEKDGTPSGASVVRADPPQYFDQAALETVAGWRFAHRDRRMCDVYQWVRFPLGG